MVQTTSVHSAMQFAYNVEGVKNFSQLEGMYTSGVQHSANRTKSIMKRAQRYLDQHGVAHTLTVVRSQAGEVMHFIK